MLEVCVAVGNQCARGSLSCSTVRALSLEISKQKSTAGISQNFPTTTEIGWLAHAAAVQKSRPHTGHSTLPPPGVAPTSSLTVSTLQYVCAFQRSALHRLKQQPPLAAAVVVGRELARDAAVEALHARHLLLVEHDVRRVGPLSTDDEPE